MAEFDTIIWLIIWPFMILGTYFLAKYGLKKLDNNLKKEEEKD
ncbi:MAG: hypothetical protein ACOXZK_06915 [Bacteroidales bacterium]|jgi:hypothetical protein